MELCDVLGGDCFCDIITARHIGDVALERQLCLFALCMTVMGAVPVALTEMGWIDAFVACNPLNFCLELSYACAAADRRGPQQVYKKIV